MLQIFLYIIRRRNKKEEEKLGRKEEVVVVNFFPRSYFPIKQISNLTHFLEARLNFFLKLSIFTSSTSLLCIFKCLQMVSYPYGCNFWLLNPGVSLLCMLYLMASHSNLGLPSHWWHYADQASCPAETFAAQFFVSVCFVSGSPLFCALLRYSSKTLHTCFLSRFTSILIINP